MEIKIKTPKKKKKSKKGTERDKIPQSNVFVNYGSSSPSLGPNARHSDASAKAEAGLKSKPRTESSVESRVSFEKEPSYHATSQQPSSRIKTQENFRRSSMKLTN